MARLVWGNEARDALGLLKLYVQQQWDAGMLSLICDVEDDTAIAVQRGLHNLERHISVLQFRKSHHQTSITSFFQPSANLDSEEGPGEGGEETLGPGEALGDSESRLE